eukprot:902621-Prorocentrum_minimum.AAC.2
MFEIFWNFPHVWFRLRRRRKPARSAGALPPVGATLAIDRRSTNHEAAMFGGGEADAAGEGRRGGDKARHAARREKEARQQSALLARKAGR